MTTKITAWLAALLICATASGTHNAQVVSLTDAVQKANAALLKADSAAAAETSQSPLPDSYQLKGVTELERHQMSDGSIKLVGRIGINRRLRYRAEVVQPQLDAAAQAIATAMEGVQKKVAAFESKWHRERNGLRYNNGVSCPIHRRTMSAAKFQSIRAGIVAKNRGPVDRAQNDLKQLKVRLEKEKNQAQAVAGLIQVEIMVPASVAAQIPAKANVPSIRLLVQVVNVTTEEDPDILGGARHVSGLQLRTVEPTAVADGR